MAETFDLLIKGASVADGTGNPRYRSDIGISGRRIAAIERNIKLSSAKKVLRAGGRVVCPGFIDTHTHDDLYVLVKPTCDDKILQGVTTVALGNCGLSPGPVSPKHQKEMAAFLSVAGTKHLEEEDLNIGTFEDWLAKLESVKPGINVMSLVGHITIRIAVMGIENRPPTKREMAAMKKLTAASMESGAYGLSSGLIYAPGNYAETAEITELAKVAARYNGIYTTHLRNESDFVVSALTEALEIGKSAAIPVHISHHKVLGKQNWGGCGETLRLIAEARNGGLTVTCDQYPYQAASTFLHAALPPGILAHGDRVFTEILRDPDARTELIRQIENSSEKGWENLIRGAGFEGIYIATAGKHEHYVGRSVADIAETEDKNPYDVVFDLLAEEERGVVAIFFMINEDDIVEVMRSPLTMIGSDGIPGFGVEKTHPRQTGTFPRILGRYVREKGILDLEEAVRKMTSLPAQTFGLKRKGLLKEGFDADLVVFDPETVLDRATYEDPNQAPVGIDTVLVNGRIAVEKGKVAGADSGKVLRRGSENRIVSRP